MMNEANITDPPEIYPELQAKCEEIGFTMPSDLYTGTLLKTLVTSKPAANILELGTGIGLSLCWMVDGMDANSKLTTIDNDTQLVEIARHYFGKDDRVAIVCENGSDWIKRYTGDPFDLVFADAWPGKYSELDELLALLKMGGLYVIDDMLPQPNWPEGHEQKAQDLVTNLEERSDLSVVKMSWSTGVIIAAKKC